MKESNPKHSLDDYDFGELAKTESNAQEAFKKTS